jgi:septal ring factor EnvC (AmiA/AmiB activator)
MRAIRERPRLAAAKLAAALAAPVATALLAAAVANNDSDGSADLQRRLNRSEQPRHEQSGELQHLAAELNRLRAGLPAATSRARARARTGERLRRDLLAARRRLARERQ